MKTKFVMLMLAATLVTTAHASKFVLPDSCGSEKVDFDVNSKKDQPAPAPPEEGKAQIVFIESLEKSGVLGTPTNRYGMDGAWVGANKGNSYFTVSVAPGEHHLCSNWAKNVGMTVINV
jgi:hypothetical protein